MNLQQLEAKIMFDLDGKEFDDKNSCNYTIGKMIRGYITEFLKDDENIFLSYKGNRNFVGVHLGYYGSFIVGIEYRTRKTRKGFVVIDVAAKYSNQLHQTTKETTLEEEMALGRIDMIKEEQRKNNKIQAVVDEINEAMSEGNFLKAYSALVDNHYLGYSQRQQVLEQLRNEVK